MSADDKTEDVRACGLAPAHGSAARLKDLKRRLTNARQRAAYACERPSFSRNVWRRRKGATNQRRAEELYELAMCDIRSLSSAIEYITGKRPKLSDPKQAFREHFTRVIMPAIAKQNTETSRRRSAPANGSAG